MRLRSFTAHKEFTIYIVYVYTKKIKYYQCSLSFEYKYISMLKKKKKTDETQGESHE